MPNDNDFERSALDLLKRAGALSVPVNLEKVAMFLGANVHEQVLEDQVSGALVIKDRAKHILVNSTHHVNRQRFTIAHELGHLTIHASEVDQLFVDTQIRVYQRRGESGSAAYHSEGSTTTPEQERQANAFAAALLMPAELLKIRVDQNMLVDEHDIAVLSREFGVSEQAMYIRLQRLNLVEVFATRT